MKTIQVGLRLMPTMAVFLVYINSTSDNMAHTTHISIKSQSNQLFLAIKAAAQAPSPHQIH